MNITKLTSIGFWFVVFLSASAHAQFTGFVLDQQNNDPIFGATVATQDLVFGTQTDRSGYFELLIDNFPATIVISYVGYESEIITVDSANTEKTIALTPNIFEGGQVTITADRVQLSERESRPIAVNSIKPSDMLMTIRASAPEMLRAEPGVYVQQTTIGQGSVYVRGRSGRDVLYLFNNFRINPGFTRAGQNQYFAAIDPFALDEIRVYRGPISVYYGSDALSGGVHIKPFIPAFSDSSLTNGSVLFQTNFRGTAERTATARIQHQQQNLSFSLNGTLREFQYYRMPSSSNDDRWFPYGRKLNLAEMNFGAINATARYRLNPSSQVTFVSYYSRIPDSPRMDRMMLGYDIETDPAPAHPRSGYFSNTAPLVFSAHSLSYMASVNSPVISNIRVRAGFHRLRDDRREREYENPPVYSKNSSTRSPDYLLSADLITDRNRSDQWLFSTDFISPVSDQFTISWGGDFTYEEIRSSVSLNGFSNGLPRYPDGSEIVSAGFFAHADYNITTRFLLESGVRYSISHNRIPFEGNHSERGFNPFTESFSQLTGSVGARYSLNKMVDLTSNVSSGFRAPNIADLAEIGIRRSDQFQSPNTDLTPEKSLNIDAGLHIRTGVLNLETHVFWLHYFDKIERILTGDIVNRNGEFIRSGSSTETVEEFVEVISSNAGSMDIYGVEIGAQIQFDDFAKGGATFTYNYGQLKNPDGSTEPADRIPPANGLVYFSLERINNFSIRPQVRYNMAHRRLSPSEYGDNRISKNGTNGFVNLQFITVYDGIPSMQLKIFADNLLDQSYREHASSLDGLTRNVTVSLSYAF